MRSKPLNVLILLGSPREDGNSSRLAFAFAFLPQPGFGFGPGFAPVGFPAGFKSEELPAELRYPHDPKKAKALLAEARPAVEA